MAVKAVEMVRKIRDKHYEETKEFSVEEQIKFVKKKSGELQKRLKRSQRSTADNRAQTTKV
jgi:deoxyadenosine/deoxycytidine kinase